MYPLSNSRKIKLYLGGWRFMEIDIIKQFEELMNAFGLKLTRIKFTYSDNSDFDKGLRSLLYGGYDYLHEIKRIQKYYNEHTLYIIKDIFESHYVSFLLPRELTESDETEFLHLGPYITKEPEEIIERVLEKKEFLLYFRNDLKEYYYGLPLIKNEELLESIIIVQAGYIFGGRERVRVHRFENVDVRRVSMKELIEESDDRLATAFIKERYRYEDMMLDAIRNGDQEKVIEVNKQFTIYRLQPRSEDRLRDTKNLMIVWNTLFRKAVQQADVHPVHIDKLSTLFAKKIESCTHINMLIDLSQEMTHKYCLLVRNHSLKGYSQLVKDTLNYIDFNLKEPLSLKLLAGKVNANASYLSTQFRKETGKTMIDYINEKRIHNSLVLLATTDIPIQMVAEKVGIHDENYFSRLFKKYQKQTAKQYRNLMQSKV